MKGPVVITVSYIDYERIISASLGTTHIIRAVFSYNRYKTGPQSLRNLHAVKLAIMVRKSLYQLT